MAVRCIIRYRAVYTTGGSPVALDYLPGDIISDADLASWLLRDAPGAFEVVEEVAVRALSEPPAHRMVTGEDSMIRASTVQDTEMLGTAETTNIHLIHAEPHVMTPETFGASKLPEHRTGRSRRKP